VFSRRPSECARTWPSADCGFWVRFVNKVGRKPLFVSDHGLCRQQNVYQSDERR